MWRIAPLIRLFGVALAGILLIIAVLFVYFNLPGPEPKKDVTFGVTYSARFATELGLDWKVAYLAILDDLGVRKIRIPVYWDLVEPARGVADYADIDWQLQEARARGADVILVVGQRVPRWPECHIPGWVAEKGSDAYREAELFGFIERTVTRYREGHPEIAVWQVENEPFLTFFGVCPTFRRAYLDDEIALVRSLDPSRPVMITDSGELSTWYAAASRADIFGTTMYRKIYKDRIGYITYPLGPNFFRFKERLTRLLTDQDRFVVIELQGEPWANGTVADLPLEEQFRTMDERQLADIAEYARRVQFGEIYFWGAEWWYWLKEKREYPALWETAREIIRGTPGE